jgi:hypothetical protein
MLISRYWSSIRPETPRKIIKGLGTAAALAEIRNFYVPNKNYMLYHFANPVRHLLSVLGIVLLLL